jgi:hypothetical protein
MSTDERRQTVRRNEDVVSHAQLASELKQVRQEIVEHVHPEVVRIIDLLEGPCETHLDGSTTRNHGEGIVQQVKDVKRMVANGVKVKQSLATADWVKIVVALITTAGVIIGAT